MAYVFVEVDKTLNGSHSGISGSSSHTTTSSSGVDLRNWVKNILIIGDPIAVLNSGDPDFLPTVAQMYLEGDRDVVESLTDWYPELKPIVENYISTTTTTSSGRTSSHSGSAAASTPTSSSHTTTSSRTTTTTSSGRTSSHSGSAAASTPTSSSHTTTSSRTTTTTSSGSTSSHSSSSGTQSTPRTHTNSGSTSSSPLDNLQNEYDEEAMRIYQEAMKESNNTSAAIDETPANYNTAQLERKQVNYWPYILGGVAAVGLIYLLSRKKKTDKK